MLVRVSALVAASALLLGISASANAAIITFGGKAHGEVVDTDFAGQGIANIIVTNLGSGTCNDGACDHPDLGIIFDTDRAADPYDPDLLGPTSGGTWATGNLAPNTVLGNALIIAEKDNGTCGDDICDDPDDEGDRPAGSFEIVFTTSVLSSFGFDIVDVEDTTVENGSIVFHDGLSTFTIGFDDFEAGGSFDGFAPGLAFGNNSANRISPITPGDVGLTKFDKVVINMGGSGAIDNLTIPEPGLGLLLLTGGVLLGAARRL